MTKYTEQEQMEIKRFTWNPSPTPDQIARMNMMRIHGEHMCELMIANVENCADRSAAIRDLRKAIMQCNLAIAHENISECDWEPSDIVEVVNEDK